MSMAFESIAEPSQEDLLPLERSAQSVHSTSVDVQDLLLRAFRFESRLDTLLEQLDPSWNNSPIAKHLSEFKNFADSVQRRVAVVVFRHWCGDLPQPQQLSDPCHSLALCDRAELLARLCSLALMLRPGVLRCCVDARVRDMLRAALGESFEALRTQTRGGRPVSSQVARREPLVWACVGFQDLTTAGLLSCQALKRLIRLSLPKQWPDMSNEAEPLLKLTAAQVSHAMTTVLKIRGEQPW
jgi:Bacterial type III secretion protein (HrpB4)